VTGDDPGSVATRVRASSVCRALVCALDDWSLCVQDPSRKEWLLAVVELADPDRNELRARLRDRAVAPDESTIAELSRQAQAGQLSVGLLLGFLERMHASGANAAPFLLGVQRSYPGDFWVNYMLGVEIWKQQPAEALRYLQSAVALRPRAPVPYYALGNTLLRLARIDEGIACFRQGVQADPDFWGGHNGLGRALLGSGHPHEAVVELRQSIRLNPGHAWMHLDLGNALRADRRPEEALGVYETAVRLEPKNAILQYVLGDCFMALRRFEDALEPLQAAAELQDQSAYRIQLGLCLIKLGRFERAEEQLRKAAQLNPSDGDVRICQSDLLIRLGRN